LGTPAWVRGDERYVLAQTRRSALRVVLAARGRWVQRSEVQELFWPDQDALRAARNLRQLLHGAAREPWLPPIEREGAALRFAPPTDVQDVRAALRADRLEEAVEAYGGPFLDRFDLPRAHEFEAWLAFEREALHERWRSAALTLIDRWIVEGRPKAALDLADRILSGDTIDEAAALAGMRAARAAGDEASVQRRFDDLARHLAQELGMAPSPDTLAWLASPVEGSGGAVSRPAMAGAGGAPPQADPVPASVEQAGVDFVGRGRERRAVLDAFAHDGARLVTLVAPGGMGKTRLARAVGADAVPRLATSLVVARLDHVEDASGIVAACAAVAGGHGGEPWPRLLEALRERSPLLVLDGAERHVGSALDGVVERLLSEAPDLRILVTSRVRLGHDQERAIVLGGLDRDAAARLFRRAAERRIGRRRARALPQEDVEAVVVGLGGMPLAVELAASWTDVLSPARIAAQVRSDWELLRRDDATGRRPVIDLTGLLAEGWHRLDEEDRAGWSALALAPASLDVEIAASMVPRGWTGLRRLIDHGVLRPDGERVHMHPLLARFARERGGYGDATMERFEAPFVERLAREELRGPVVLHHPHPDDVDAALTAFGRALKRGHHRSVAAMAHGLGQALNLSTRHAERRHLFDDAAARLDGPDADDDSGRTRALARALAHGTLRSDSGYAEHGRALALAERVDDTETMAWTHFYLARCPPLATARTHYREGVRLFRRLGDPDGVGRTAAIYGRLLAESGRRSESRDRQAEAREAFEAAGIVLGVGETLDNLWRLNLLELDLDAAEACVLEAIERFASIGDAGRVLLGYARRAWVDAYRPDPDRARRGVERFVRRFGRAEPIRASALRAVVAYRNGDLDEAARHAHGWAATSLVVGQETTVPPVKAFLVLARTEAAEGRHGAAAVHLREALVAARASFWVRDRVEAALHVAAWLTETGCTAPALELAARVDRHPAADPLMRADAAGLAIASVLRPVASESAWADVHDDDGLADRAADALATATGGAG
jgi:DNA-binding SARP family transcriptional activator/predicted ATPase